MSQEPSIDGIPMSQMEVATYVGAELSMLVCGETLATELGHVRRFSGNARQRRKKSRAWERYSAWLDRRRARDEKYRQDRHRLHEEMVTSGINDFLRSKFGELAPTVSYH